MKTQLENSVPGEGTEPPCTAPYSPFTHTFFALYNSSSWLFLSWTLCNKPVMIGKVLFWVLQIILTNYWTCRGGRLWEASEFIVSQSEWWWQLGTWDLWMTSELEQSHETALIGSGANSSRIVSELNWLHKTPNWWRVGEVVTEKTLCIWCQKCWVKNSSEPLIFIH